MNKTWWAKFSLLAVVTIVAALSLVPTFSKTDFSKTKYPFSNKINLGLDLQGGLYLVLTIDFNKVFKDLMERQKGQIETLLKDNNLVAKDIQLVLPADAPKDDTRVLINADAATITKLKDLVQRDFVRLRVASEKTDSVEYGLKFDEKGLIRERTLGQSIEVLRNRIDEFGVAEPSISSQGNDRVVVELPGIKEVEHAKSLIGKTAKLEFKIVDRDSLQPGQLEALIATAEKEKNIKFDEASGKFSDYVAALNAALVGKIPATTELGFERVKNDATGEYLPNARIPYLLIKKVEVTGEDLDDAQVTMDQNTQLPAVSFRMSARGAVAFGKLTEANINKQLAIVLDGIVMSAPNINSRISDSGQITVGGNYDKAMRESQDLSIVLRAGALPAQLEFSEQRVVGPSLGLDSIKKGTNASLIGILAVFILMIFYYRISGMIAVFSLALNVVFVLAILVALEATLTLPGIAGIALTVGIAVDSNVVIYERIREELRSGKSVLSAVDMGFDKAFRTILDANVANGVAAIILMMYGTGPIKGFAVTMMIGIVTTLFTAVFVCRLVFDLWLSRLEAQKAKTLSI